MICYFSNIWVHFVFCQLNFILLFPFFIKYFHVLFIIIVFRLGRDKLSSVSSILSFPRDQSRDVTPRLGEGGCFFIFEYLSPLCFLSIEFHCTFSIFVYY